MLGFLLHSLALGIFIFAILGVLKIATEAFVAVSHSEEMDEMKTMIKKSIPYRMAVATMRGLWKLCQFLGVDRPY